MELAQVYDALTPLRAPLQRGEYDLHRMVREALMNAGFPPPMRCGWLPDAAST